ncbi:tyrosine-protein kinase SYK-like [Petromyzon marinus]|uniref:tyrosine-protein kinase SYK-like n=1 Tax=Petromyzon marinus TaxID=7757 RepID=UPI003F705ECF
MSTDTESLSYYYGFITRKEAERFLKRGRRDGCYLLRASRSHLGGFVLSVRYRRGQFKHYPVVRTGGGRFAIAGEAATTLEEDGVGAEHASPAELCSYHCLVADRLCCVLTDAVQRPPEFKPGSPLFDVVKEKTLRAYVRDNLGLQGEALEEYLRTRGHELEPMVVSTLHEQMAWFHRRITRREAEARLMRGGHASNGTFLVRERDAGTYAVSLVHKGRVIHYEVTRDAGGRLLLGKSQYDTLCQLVEFYSKNCGGIARTLRKACAAPDLGPRLPDNHRHSAPPSPQPRRWMTHLRYSLPLFRRAPAPARGGEYDFQDNWRNLYEINRRALPHETPVYNSLYEDPEEVRGRGMFLQRERLTLDCGNQLGSGNFGAVLRGIYKFQRKEVQVAVKVLKPVENQEMLKTELMKEAELMHQLDHPYIVRMFGVCEGEALMLVMEVAYLGPLNKYLKEHKETMSSNHLVELMHQVSDGMKYLEERSFVHRDLAARNVLLVSERYAKISDFGLSKALAAGESYYKAKVSGKWPLKWYAPECIQHFEFSSKGDVWSFGVTMWETFTYGDRPYKGFKAAVLLDFLKAEKRLDKPPGCPEAIYELMLKTWNTDTNLRPSFSDIEDTLGRYLAGK